MKIKRIAIKNYKSIKDIDVSFSDNVNVFVGENSVGKSNIFNALEWVLGASYPSFSNISQEAYYNGDQSLPISIKIFFDDDNYLAMESVWVDKSGRRKNGLHLNTYDYVTDDTRQKYVSAFIGVDRKISDNPAANRWTILGRLLQDINSLFIKDECEDEYGNRVSKSEAFKAKMISLRDEFLFSVKNDDNVNIMERFSTILSEETARQLNRNPSDFSMDLNIYDPWNYYRTLQIIVNESESNMKFRASELGMGVQASITIAILKAYSELKLKNSTPIFIDEPELFLHPQGRRNFYKIIRELADSGTQVFLTTHSTEFIDLYHFDELNVVRKSKEKGTYIRKAVPQDFVEDYSIRSHRKSDVDDIMAIYANAFENTSDSQKSCEAIFARKVILVEGCSEVLIVPYLFELCGFDLILNGITVVRCGGKSELDRFYRLYSEFGIPCYIIFDGDYQNKGKDDEKSTIEKNHGILSLFGNADDFPDNKAHDRYLGFLYRLEENLNIDNPEGKGRNLFKGVKAEITSRENVPSWVYDVIEKLRLLPNEVESVLQKYNPTTSDLFDDPFDIF